jgi:hypothetical protein
VAFNSEKNALIRKKKNAMLPQSISSAPIAIGRTGLISFTALLLSKLPQ